MRAVTRLAMIGAFLALALAAALLGRPQPAPGAKARLAVVVGAAAATDEGLDRLDQLDRRSGRPVPPAHRGPDPLHRRTHRQVTVVMSGDLLWHDLVWQSAHADAVRRGLAQRYDFDPMFAAMKPVVQDADLAICHEEVPFADDDRHLSNYPVFAAPPQIARWIASMGWDACTTDSNHSIDQGFPGLVRTATMLERAGVRHVGTFRSEAERRRPVILTSADGVRVAVVGGTYSLNGLSLPTDKRWAVSMWDARNLLAQARAARAAGADIVLVQYHGGDEYSPRPNAAQTALVGRLTASPAVDLVFAEHAHVVQPITRVNGKWVVYGMGNMVAQSDPRYPRAYEGITVRFTFRESGDRFRVSRAEYLPTVWNPTSSSGAIRIQRVDPALAHGAADRARLLEARRMTRLAVHGLDHAGTASRDTSVRLRER